MTYTNANDLTATAPSLDAAMTEAVKLINKGERDTLNRTIGEKLFAAVTSAMEERWEMAKNDCGAARRFATAKGSMDAKTVAYYVDQAICTRARYAA